jgi:hypothetical protein
MLRRDGRKHVVGTALLGAGGAVLAKAEALWIEPRQSPSDDATSR